MIRAGRLALLFGALCLAVAQLGLLGVEGVVRAEGAQQGQTPPASEQLMLFYDPYANHQAILNLTVYFDLFFESQKLPIRFQAVRHRDSFEALLAGSSVALAIVSSDLLGDRAGNRLNPILVPASKGDVTFHKVLVDRDQGKTTAFQGKRISAAATTADPAEASAKVLTELFGAGLATDGLMVIPVSKDVDALLTLGFGHVDGALVTPQSIEVVRRINPKIAESFRTVLSTRGRLRSPLCVVRGRMAPSTQDRFVEAVRHMGETQAGANAMSILGFDSWVDFNPAVHDPTGRAP